jgi:hypothetical protein
VTAVGFSPSAGFVRWKAALPRSGNGSPIVVKDRVLVTSAKDADGHGRSLYVRWEERAGSYWASLVTAGGLIYATDQRATTIVFRPNGERFERLATNRLSGSCHATPAIADGSIYIRTDGGLYGIGPSISAARRSGSGAPD